MRHPPAPDDCEPPGLRASLRRPARARCEVRCRARCQLRWPFVRRRSSTCSYAVIIALEPGPRHHGHCAASANGNYVDLPSPTESGDVVSERVRRRIRSAARVDLAIDVGDVALHRVHTETQPGGDLLVGITRGELPQHFDLARRESIRLRTLHHRLAAGLRLADAEPQYRAYNGIRVADVGIRGLAFQ